MRVLLTGATGFLGKNVAWAFAEAGHDLRILVRETSNRNWLPEGAEFVPGDVTDLTSLVRAGEGSQGIVHMAGLVKVWDPDPRRFEAVNVGGLRNCLEASQRAGARLVYTSSFIAVGPTTSEPADESTVHPGDRYRNAYERTKAMADVIARGAALRGADVVIVYPGVVYGPGEVTDGNIVVKMVADHMKGRFPGIIGPGDRLWSYAFVEDVARGHVLAMERGRSGERYFLCGDNVSMNDLFATLERVSGIPRPTRHLPYSVAKALGATLYAWAEMTGRPPLLTHEVVDVFKEHWAYRSDKAKSDLGYEPASLEDGLSRTVAWLRNEGVA